MGVGEGMGGWGVVGGYEPVWYTDGFQHTPDMTHHQKSVIEIFGIHKSAC